MRSISADYLSETFFKINNGYLPFVVIISKKEVNSG